MRNTLLRKFLIFGLFAAAFALLSQATFAANKGTNTISPLPNRVTQHVDEGQLTKLFGNTRPEANFKNDRGAIASDFDVEHILMVLQRSPEQEKKLNKFIDQLNDRKSPNFHHWLTAEEFGKRYGVSDADIESVTNWLQSHGFRINQVYPNRMFIDFSGTAGQIREGFHSDLHQLEVEGEKHIANMNDPHVPAALAPVVRGIASLNDFKPRPMYRNAKDYTYADCTTLPTQSGTNCYAITPQDNAAIYNLNPLFSNGISGQGQTIVLIEDTDTYGGAADWNTYRSTFGLASAFPAGTYTQVHPGGCSDPGTNGDDGEAAIDVEVASAIAPSAAIELASCAGGTVTFGGLLALQNLVNAAGPYPGIVSVSYGVCEALNGNGGNAAFSNTYQQAASQGISVFVSSGDDGPSSCANEFGVEYDNSGEAVTGWGESPYNVSVGGTDFEDVYNAKTGQNGGAPLTNYWGPNSANYGSALSYIPEIPWNDACASTLISFVATGSFTPYGASPATCNNTAYNTTTTYLSLGAGSGGASNCATGQEGTNASSSAIVSPQCQGYAKPSFQTGAALTGGTAVYGSTNDGVRDIPDVAMFAANGSWGHFETVCWSDPTQTSGGAAACTGAPSGWSGFGGTSVATPTMAAIQALINQKTNQTWGNPDPIYYQIAQNQYGSVGGTFLGTACNSSTGNTGGCAFNDVTQGDIDLACKYDGTLQKAHCYLPTGTYGTTSTNNITGATVLVGGSGYTSAPTCTIAGPTNSNPYKSPTGVVLFAGGTQAACTATVNAATKTAVWTIAITVAADAATQQVIVGSQTYTLAGASTTAIATALTTAINANNTVATAARTSATVTVTAKVTGAAGNFSVSYGTADEFNNFGVAITNTTLGEGPNYVSGITITNAGSGYQPETPMTLTGGGGTGAVAVANSVFTTGAQSYQPTYGAAPGYDLATGLGTPNATALANSTVWGPAQSFSLSANPTSVSISQGGGAGTSTITVTPAGGFNGSVTLSATNVPTGVTATFGTNPTTGTSVLSLTASGAAAATTSTITINGVSGALNASTTVSLTVNAGTPGIYSPANGSTLTSTTATFQWVGNPTATAYWLDVGSTQGAHDYYSSGSLSTSTFSQTVNSLPTNGSTVWARWYYLVSGTWQFIDYSYTSFGSSTKATMTSPTPSSMLSGSSVVFTWSSAAGATGYWLDAGSTAGAHDYYSSGNLGTALTTTVNGLPTNGTTVYVTLYTLQNGNWLSNAYTYTAYNLSAANAVMTSPTPGSTLTSGTVTFSWSAGTGASGYWVDAGSTAGAHDYYSSGNLGNVLSTTVSGLPTDGSTVYVTLYTLIGSTWSANAYTYTALNGTSGLAVMQTPTPSTTLSGGTATFTWSSDPNATAYWMDIGSVAGGNTIYSSGNLGTALTTTVNSLPADGSTIYVTLYSFVGGQWLNNSYTYVSGP